MNYPQRQQQQQPFGQQSYKGKPMKGKNMGQQPLYQHGGYDKHKEPMLNKVRRTRSTPADLPRPADFLLHQAQPEPTSSHALLCSHLTQLTRHTAPPPLPETQYRQSQP